MAIAPIQPLQPAQALAQIQPLKPAASGAGEPATARVVPHSSQNFASETRPVPQVGHVRARGLPHSRQYLLACLLSTPQLAQRMFSASARRKASPGSRVPFD